MIKFIKNLLGFGAKETVKEILTPQAPYKVEPPKEVVITPAVAPVKAKPAVKEGSQRANVKKPNPNSKKPPAPPAAKPKAKPKAKAKK